jgi:hypothetical protein
MRAMEPAGDENLSQILLLAVSLNLIWHAAVIILAISLVYGATRHEQMGPILYHAYRTAFWIVGFVLAIGVVLTAISWFT